MPAKPGIVHTVPMDFVFAYLAGLLTLINPCVLPVLPIVLVSALNADRYGPVALAAGMSVSFVTFGLFVTAFGPAIGLTQDTIAQAGAVLMIVFGTVLVVPMFVRQFEMATAGFASQADSRMNDVDASGKKGQFLGGLLLGAVWSPCIGPTLGGAIALASQGSKPRLRGVDHGLFCHGRVHSDHRSWPWRPRSDPHTGPSLAWDRRTLQTDPRRHLHRCRADAVFSSSPHHRSMGA